MHQQRVCIVGVKVLSMWNIGGWGQILGRKRFLKLFLPSWIRKRSPISKIIFTEKITLKPFFCIHHQPRIDSSPSIISTASLYRRCYSIDRVLRKLIQSIEET